jgi:hypothetical protein
MTSPHAQTAVECPHGLRPGTTVCLRCRQDARSVARQKRVRFLGRVGLVFAGAVVVITLLIGAWNALATDRGGADEPPNTTPQTPSSPGSATAPPAGSRTVLASGLEPTMAEGRRHLGDSVFAIRDGAQVTVHFDTDSLRTRLDWKFEGIVRATLPLVFGAEAAAALDSVPAGTLASGGQLLTELPRRGITLKVGDQALKVWPVTRQGRDGPLVVGYRAAAAAR